MTARLLRTFPLRAGSHADPNDGMCAMEMVAWLAGEPHSDDPACADPVLAAVVRCFNDTLPDDARERLLRPLVPLLVHTRSGATAEHARAWLAVDCAARTFAPRALRNAGLGPAADALAALPELRCAVTARAALRHLDPRAARTARWLVQRACEGVLPPRVWVAGVVWAGREAGAEFAWPILADLIRRMARWSPGAGRARAGRLAAGGR
ncbi:MAG TPA: hypothetical protein VK081_15045 [Planctomycetota bacterium]|nr:hypothetical protein [Planctomycetota bacterium]